MMPLALRSLIAAAVLVPGLALGQSAFEQANEALFRQLREVHGLDEAQMARVRAIFARSGYVGQGNPAISEHPITAEECRARVDVAAYADPVDELICGAPYMAPLYDPETETPADAKACIDRFEFPGIPCTYPVVWVRAKEAAEICEAVGKRLCDAHEWEGACAGRLLPPDYDFDRVKGLGGAEAFRRLRRLHNDRYAASKTWSYGPEYQKGVCAAASRKSPGCEGGGWSRCGSNTYPTGAFPDCRSSLGVYDIHGNAAEHMNLPVTPEQMVSRGSKTLGHTEMKGSWFIWDRYHAHPDWCRWRAPYWHGSRVMDPHSHANYHLGFRCCKTVGGD